MLLTSVGGWSSVLASMMTDYHTMLKILTIWPMPGKQDQGVDGKANETSQLVPGLLPSSEQADNIITSGRVRMGANKIERPLVTDPRILARFQQTQRGEADAEARKLAEAKTGDVRRPTGEKLEISSSAHRVADMRSLVEAGRTRIEAEPEVRADRVAAARRRLEAGVYTTAEARQRTAEQLSPVLQDLSRLLD